MAEKPKIVTLCGLSRFVDIMAVSLCPRRADFLRRLQASGQGRRLAALSDARGVQLLLSKGVGEPEVGARSQSRHSTGLSYAPVAEKPGLCLGLAWAGGGEKGRIGNNRDKESRNSPELRSLNVSQTPARAHKKKRPPAIARERATAGRAVRSCTRGVRGDLRDDYGAR